MSDKPKPSFAPIYCGIYPELAELFRGHGYALAVHGSLQRDFDLIAVKWAAEPSSELTVIKDIEKKFAICRTGKIEIKYHGRTVFTLSISFGQCFIDLSFV